MIKNLRYKRFSLKLEGFRKDDDGFVLNVLPLIAIESLTKFTIYRYNLFRSLVKPWDYFPIHTFFLSLQHLRVFKATLNGQLNSYVYQRLGSIRAIIETFKELVHIQVMNLVVKDLERLEEDDRKRRLRLEFDSPSLTEKEYDELCSKFPKWEILCPCKET